MLSPLLEKSIAISGHIVTATSVLVAVYVYRRTMNSQVFLEFTRRYVEVMESFPAANRGARLDSGGDPPASSPELTEAALRYLNLCSEEFYLWKRGYLSGDIWRIWEAELRRTLGSPLYRREWRTLAREFSSFPEFMAYVQDAQSSAHL